LENISHDKENYPPKLTNVWVEIKSGGRRHKISLDNEATGNSFKSTATLYQDRPPVSVTLHRERLRASHQLNTAFYNHPHKLSSSTSEADLATNPSSPYTEKRSPQKVDADNLEIGLEPTQPECSPELADERDKNSLKRLAEIDEDPSKKQKL
jgi:hypothetical protein